MSNFIEKCLNGEALLDDIDDFVDEWHESEPDVPLYQFLGMKKSEYSLWVADAGVLPFIVNAHRLKVEVPDLLNDLNTLPLAARSDGPVKAKQLMNWLKKEGLWE